MVIRYPEAIVLRVAIYTDTDNIVNVSKPLFFFINPLHQFLQSRTNHLSPKTYK